VLGATIEKLPFLLWGSRVGPSDSGSTVIS